MASLNFPPTTPGVPGPEYTLNGIVYYWDGEKWTANNEDGFTDVFVNVDGDNMTGDLTLGTDKITLDATNGIATLAGGSNFGNRIAVESGGFAFVAKETGASTNKGALMNTGEFRIGPDVNNINTLTARIQVDGSAEFAGDVQMASQNGGQLAGFRNLIINGDFRIWQRSTSGTNTSSNAKYVSADRFAAGSSATLARDSVAPEGFIYGARSEGNIIQCIELESYSFPVGSKYTLSVWCDRDMSTVNTNIKFRDSLNDATNSVNAADAVAYTSTGETSGIYTRYAATVEINATPKASSNALLVFIINPAAGSNTKFAGVQLEPGPVATPFEHRPIAAELALCQRYYQTGRLVWQNYASSTGGTTTTSLLPVTMRTVSATVVTNSSSGGTIGSARLLQGYGRNPSTIQLSTSDTGAGNQNATDYAVDAEL